MAYIDETYGKQLEEVLRGLVSRPALGQPWFGFHESEVPAGVLLFTATTHSRVLYADFWNYIQNKNLVKTEEEWQSIYNEQGWCPFYSDGDGIDTFRMPSAPLYLHGANAGDAGTYVQEGLPITPETSKILFGVWAISAPQQPIPDATVEGIISELGVTSNSALEANIKAEEAIDGLNGVVRSVNGVSADAEGDVSIAYEAGDIVTFSDDVYGAGFITGSAQRFYMQIPLDRPITANSFSIIGGGINVRTSGTTAISGKYLKDLNVTQPLITPSGIGFYLNNSSGWGVPNNNAISYQIAHLKIQFS